MYKIICFVITVFVFLQSCKEVNNGNNVRKRSDNFLELYYLAPNRLYPMKFNCGNLQSGPLPNDSERYYLKVTDSSFMTKFKSLYSELSSIDGDNNDFDAKTQILVHLDNKTDTICMGRNNGIIINGAAKSNSPKFFKLINDEIEKNYSPHLKK